MSDDLTTNLFTMFSNVKFKENVNMHGIGLGLTMCKRIVDAFNGKIQCKSILNQGM
jgi:K+-sensing histidine kinase KdpD